ncbi:hypothetical protein Tco_0615877 [Tanacetum coccineum]
MENSKGLSSNMYSNGNFMSLFGQDVETFTRTMLLNVDQLQKQLDKDELQEDGSMTAFWVITRTVLLNTLESRFNTSKMQTQESKIDTGKALDADLVDTESIGTDSTVQDDNSRSGNDTDADDADIIRSGSIKIINLLWDASTYASHFGMHHNCQDKRISPDVHISPFKKSKQ